MKQLIVVALISLPIPATAGAWQYTTEVDQFAAMTRHIVRWNADDATLSLQCDSGIRERKELRVFLTVPAALKYSLAEMLVKIGDAELIGAGVWFVRASTKARTVIEAQQPIIFLGKLENAPTLALRVVTTEGPLNLHFDIGDLASAKEQLKPHCIVKYPIL